MFIQLVLIDGYNSWFCFLQRLYYQHYNLCLSALLYWRMTCYIIVNVVRVFQQLSYMVNQRLLIQFRTLYMFLVHYVYTM